MQRRNTDGAEPGRTRRSPVLHDHRPPNGQVNVEPLTPAHHDGAATLVRSLRTERVIESLWTGNPDNLPYCRSHGFDILSEAPIAGGVPSWFMQRPARAAA